MIFCYEEWSPSPFLKSPRRGTGTQVALLEADGGASSLLEADGGAAQVPDCALSDINIEQRSAILSPFTYLDI